MSWKRERKKKNQHSFLKEKRYENRKKGGWQGSKKCVVIFSGSSPTFSCRRSEPFFGKGSLLQINDSPCSCLSGKSARRTRDGWWDTLWSCLSGDLSFPPDECANRCQPPQTLGQLFLLLCQDHQGKLALQREEGNGAYKVCWCEGVWRVCLATEDVCTAHTSAPLLPSGSESHLDQWLYDLGASVSLRGWLSPITEAGDWGLIAAQKNQGQPILRPDKAFHQGLCRQHREINNYSRLARTGTLYFKEINIGKTLLKTNLWCFSFLFILSLVDSMLCEQLLNHDLIIPLLMYHY